MCLKKFAKAKFHTPFGDFTGKAVLGVLKTFSSIIKAVAARCLYGVYTLLAVWRVTEALQEPLYWLLLFTTILIALEAIHTIIARKGGELKWVTPSVFFYLMCAVPCVWLLELKLLHDRLQEQSTGNATEGSNDGGNNLINIDLSDEGWTLALEQILIFVLVFSKWIAPKGALTRDQLSQLLLVYLGAGADIIELLESFNEDEVRLNSEIVYLVMAVWSWSLLQFCIVPTAFKEMPDVEKPIDPESDSIAYSTTTEVIEIKSTLDDDISSEASPPIAKEPPNDKHKGNKVAEKRNKKIVSRSQSEGVAQAMQNGTPKANMKLPKHASVGSSLAQKGMGTNKVGNLQVPEGNKNGFEKPFTAPTKNEPSKIVNNGKPAETPVVRIVPHTCGKEGFVEETSCPDREIDDPNVVKGSWDHAVLVIHDDEDDLKLEDRLTSFFAGKTCCTAFCFYTEIWGMICSMLFQDVPFLITRLFIMFHYNVVSHMTIFFTFKNAVIILLLLNRIRVVILEEYRPWKKHMKEVKKVRKRNEEIVREQKRRAAVDLYTNPETAGHENVTVNEDDTEEARNSSNKPKKLKKPRWVFWRS